MREGSTAKKVEQETEWIEVTLTAALDRYVNPLIVTARSKKWWTPEVMDK